MYTPAERIELAQNLLRREYPDGDLDLMLPEVEEVIHLETDQIHAIREAYLTDFEEARAGRSFLFQYLATYEAWFRMTGWVLGQPTPRYVPTDYADRQQSTLDWAREYALSRETYAPYTPFIVEEWRVAYQLPATLGDQIAQEIADRSPRAMKRSAAGEIENWWDFLGYSPLVHRIFGDRYACSIPILDPQGTITYHQPQGAQVDLNSGF